MKQKMILIFTTILLVSIQGQTDAIDDAENIFYNNLTMELDNVRNPFKEDAAQDSVHLSRIDILVGALAEFDLKVVEVKVVPYVEFRFDEKKN